MTTHVHALKKYEILRGRLALSKLFATAQSCRGRWIKIFFAPIEMKGSGGLYPKALFVVGKKNRPDAVGRNRIKRLMKEAYRHEKQLAHACAEQYAGQGNTTLYIAFVYSARSKVIPSLEGCRKEIRGLLESVLKTASGSARQMR